MLEKMIKVGDKEIRMKSSAAIPRMYRVKFGRDIFLDFEQLEKAYRKNVGKAQSGLSYNDLELFEDTAYIMAKHADPSITDSVEEWLEGYEIFDIYFTLPQIFDLWKANLASLTQPKKNEKPQNEK